jgi:hypothetical protein
MAHTYTPGEMVGWQTNKDLKIGQVLRQDGERVFVRELGAKTGGWRERAASALFREEMIDEKDITRARRRGGHLPRTEVASNIPGLRLEEAGEEKGRGRSRSKGKGRGKAAAGGRSRSRSRGAGTPAKKKTSRGRSSSAARK